ncbi:MAG: YihA family ribosome biogenesis GTP-binding protein [Ruminococcaceae bacterium]|nr:YihA family ribosome biogenesis GTP-binding protein [Oscillospiraceae bacterium]
MKLNIQNSNLEITAGTPSQFPSFSLPQVAFSGRSNVGKSSLINTLLGRKKLARVSSAPGKTITVNFYSVDKKLYLVDLPGYGYAKRSIEDKKRWSGLTDGFFTARNENDNSLKAVAQLIDMKAGPTADDEMMLEYLNTVGIPYFIVVTKSDKTNKTDRNKMLEYIKNHPLVREGTTIIPFSSLKNEGKDEVWSAIMNYCD